MEDISSGLRYHNFRMRVLFPFALIIQIAVLVNSISDAIVFSYLYLIDAGLCMVWFSLAVPSYLGLFRHAGSWYRWNLALDIHMTATLVLRMILMISLVPSPSIGLLILLSLLAVIHSLDIVYYRRRQTMFSR